jgi:signal transduction histidine kinase
MIAPHIAFPWGSFIGRVVVPTLLTIVLFISAFFFVIIPIIKDSGMERKKEMIRELTNSAWNILAKLHNDERLGLLTREQAQFQAIEQIRNLHYGHEMKEYFWINDMSPRMIIHPNRLDLIQKDLSDYADPDGKRVFLEIIRLVSEEGSGYVRYKWQAHEDPSVMVPKVSYVKGFAPWGWVIGTGIYVDDIYAEMNLLVEHIVAVSLVIVMLNAFIFLHIIRGAYLTHKEQRAAALELRKARSSLALSEKMASLGRLSAMAAHEINNPLSGILSYARLSARYLEKDTVSRQDLNGVVENLRIIAGEAKRCGDIVKNLLLFAKQSLLSVQHVHMNEIIALSVRVIDHTAKMRGIRLKAEPGAGDDLVQCDPGAMQQILVALIINAIESSEEGGVVFVRAVYDREDSVCVEVEDNGCGIDEKDIPYIYDPFFSTKQEGSSLGLGLSAVYGIVQHHSGDIRVQSKKGSGTKFSISLPRVYREKGENGTGKQGV